MPIEIGTLKVGDNVTTDRDNSFKGCVTSIVGTRVRVQWYRNGAEYGDEFTYDSSKDWKMGLWTGCSKVDLAPEELAEQSLPPVIRKVRSMWRRQPFYKVLTTSAV